ncbi:MAG: permease-like cell division protein FtsX [Bacilli bacterium]|nr:permease-like cell division protein FtsX [Bacilli bacterium]
MRKEAIVIMKAIRIFLRNIRDGFKSVSRNLSLSIASISCITITLLIVAIALVVSSNVENITKLVKEDFTIVSFVDTAATSNDINELKARIEKLSNVDSVEHQTKIQIAEEMKDTSSSLAGIIDSWSNENNPLYDTLLVKVKDSEKISKTAEEIKKMDLIKDTKYGQGMVENLLVVFKVVEKAMIIAMIALVLVTLFLITNTIKITIFSRKREIEIMRLVGASNFSIKQPFVIEGLCLGFLGSLIPVALTLYGYSSLYKHFSGQLFSPFIKLVPSEPFIYIVSLILVALGVVVGMFGSYRAVRKYLKI